MCLAVPGRIVSLEDGKAVVDYDVEKREGAIIEDGYQEGDYVIIQGGVIVSKVEPEEARRALEMYKGNSV